MIRIACTRKLNPTLVAEAAHKGFIIEDKDVLLITYLCNADIARQLSVATCPIVFTSPHAVTAVMNMMQLFETKPGNIQAYCIEGKTASMASDSGFTVLHTGVNSNQLALLIQKDGVKEVLHAGANIRLDNWKTFLSTQGINVQTVEVYHKEITPQSFAPCEAVLFFSPSQIEGYLAANQLAADIPAFCIGQTTAGFLAKTGHRSTFTPTHATEQHLINTVYNYFKPTQ